MINLGAAGITDAIAHKKFEISSMDSSNTVAAPDNTNGSVISGNGNVNHSGYLPGESAENQHLLDTLRRSCELLSTSQQKIIELQRKRKESKKEIMTLSSEIERLRAENAMLRKENNQLRAEKTEAESNSTKRLTEIADKCKKAERLGKYHQEEYQRVTTEFQKMDQKHKKEVESLEKTIRILNKEISDYSFSDAKYQREIEGLRLSASDSQIQLETLRAELADSRQSFEKLDVTPDTLGTIFKRLETEFIDPILGKCALISQKMSDSQERISLLAKNSNACGKIEQNVHQIQDI